MSLTLVTGPANAEKAGVVLGRLRALLDREPILVVPTAPDVDRYRHELAGEGLVFGARVETFDRLLREIGRRAGVAGKALGRLARERVALAAAGDAKLELLAGSSTTPGFAAAACALFDELEADRITPQRLVTALRQWAAEDTARGPYGEELGRLYSAYRNRLERLERRDATLQHVAALDALREDGARWGGTPVLLYGFDDLTALQRDAVLTLAGTGAEVVVSLTYEPGRHAFAARGATVNALTPLADETVVLEPNAAHYAPASREVLHHLERRLFEEEPAGDPAPPPSPAAASAPDEPLTLFDDLAMRSGVEDPPGSAIALSRTAAAEAAPTAFARLDPGDAVTFLEGGGERAELELVALEVARLIAAGVPAEEIAVVLRQPDEAAALVAQVFEAYGVPIALQQRTQLGHTALGRGFVALLRAATGGTAQDLLAFLRTPGRVRNERWVDALEAEIRRTGARTAEAARALWERRHPDLPLGALDRVAGAHRRGAPELLERLDAELATLFAAPHRRAAPVLSAREAASAQVLAAGRRALSDLADAAAHDARLIPDPAELAALLDAVEVRVGERTVPGAVQVTDPPSLRARRVRALFLCRMQERSFPAPARPEAFLGDDELRAINAASGLRLASHEDILGVERYLLYAAVSRPEERLYVSWHAADDEGDPEVRSAFVDDLALLLVPRAMEERRRRDLGAVGWGADAAPTDRERLRAAAAAEPPVREAVAQPLRHPAILEALQQRDTWSASALEAWASCPVKWFVERWLAPGGLEPDPEAMVRGDLAHRVLEEALRRLTDAGALTPARLPEARAAVTSALDQFADRFPMSVDPSRRRAMRRRLEADLLRYVEAAAYSRTAFVPRHFEQEFEVQAAEGVKLRGRIDRVDVQARGGRADAAIVYDYKGKTAYSAKKWEEEGRFQLAVYALAARELLGLEPVGALYQPLGAEDLRPRGAIRDDADEELPVYRDDRLSADEFSAVLDGALELAVQAAGQAKSGALEPKPEKCAWGGGCAYPTICRCEG